MSNKIVLNVSMIAKTLRTPNTDNKINLVNIPRLNNLVMNTNIKNAKTLCNKKFTSNTWLGSGEYGNVYALEKNSQKVVKISFLGGNRKDIKKTWNSEVQMQKELSELKLAPKIIDSALCENENGIIIMERIYGTLRKKLLDEYGNAGACIPVELQKEIIPLLFKAVDNGYIHMDNHTDNIGLLKNGKPILIDFGFTVKRDLSPLAKIAAHIFSLYVLIEQMDLNCYDESGPILNTIEEGFKKLGLPYSNNSNNNKKTKIISKPTALKIGKTILPEWPELIVAILFYRDLVKIPFDDRQQRNAHRWICSFRRSEL